MRYLIYLNVQIANLEAIHLVGEFGGIPCKNPNSEEHGGTLVKTEEYRGTLPKTKEYRGTLPKTKEYRGTLPKTKEYRGTLPKMEEYGGKWGKTEEFCLFLRKYKFYLQIGLGFDYRDHEWLR